MSFEVRTDSLPGTATALGWARGHTVVIDRPADGGGQDLGFNGAELMHLAVAACISNDLFREARALGLRLTRVAVTARGELTGSPQVSSGIDDCVEVWETRRRRLSGNWCRGWTASPRSPTGSGRGRWYGSRRRPCIAPMACRRRTRPRAPRESPGESRPASRGECGVARRGAEDVPRRGQASVQRAGPGRADRGRGVPEGRRGAGRDSGPG